MKVDGPKGKSPVVPQAQARSADAAKTATPSTPAPKAGWGPGPAAGATAPKSDGFSTGAAAGVASRRASGPSLTGGPAAPPASGFRAAAFEAQLDADTHSKPIEGNRVTMLFDGVNSFAERDRMIDGAKSSINLQTFIFNSDDTGWALANKLADKAKQGVQVRVIYDGMGSNRSDPKMFEMMKAAGVQLFEYGPKWQVQNLNDRWHEKHLIVDGKASIEGGMNIANEYALGGSGKMVFSRGEKGVEAWRDTDVKLEGPAVGDATRAFLRNWEELGGTVSDQDKAAMLPTLTPFADGTSVRVVQNNPSVKGLEGTADKLYLDAIKNAKKSITIENAYLLPPQELRQALIDAAKRGVDVRIMTNSRESNDMGIVADASRYFYDDLLAAGVKLYEKQGGTLHAKTATFDGEYSIVGSVNLNGRSATLDAEDALGIQGQGTARELEARFQAGLPQVREITKDELGKEDFVTNLKQWALSTFAWTM